MVQYNIAIVGAGLGGLCLGALLLKSGHRVRIYEQAPELSEVGAGISVPPNAAKVLTLIDAWDDLVACSNVPQKGRLTNGKTEQIIQEFPFGTAVKERYGDCYYQLHRADFVALLQKAVTRIDPDALRLGHLFERYEQDEQGVTIKFKDQDDVKADILIGADGVRSRVREQIAGDENPRFTGYVAWRALIPSTNLPERFLEPVSKVKISAGRNITFYPIRDGKLINCAMFASDSDWTKEGWSLPAKVDDIRSAFDGFDEDTQLLINEIPEDECFQWALYDREPIKQWTDKRVVLLGDAAHPMLPFLGQGASMALEDAAELSSALAACDDFQSAFEKYVSSRSERSNWVLLESRQAGERFVSPAPTPETFGRDGAMRMDDLFGYEPPGVINVA